MALFKPTRTYDDPAQSQSGFPSPGAGAQTTGEPTYVSLGSNKESVWEPERPIKGIFSWLFGAPASDSQSGFPTPGDMAQERPGGSMPNHPVASGLPDMVWTPYYDRGAAAWVPNYGKVLTNPIGGGIQALHRTQASYGPAAQYDNGALWWTSQVIPTSINLQGLTSPDQLASFLSQEQIQAVIRTTG